MQYIYSIIFLLVLIFSKQSISTNLDVFGIGIFDIKFDGSKNNYVTDLRYEKRFDKSLINIGPKEENFFFLKPFLGFEVTSKSASYFITGIYLEDNLGQLFTGKNNKLIFTPSFGAGYYDNGSGKDLGNKLEFRTSFELSYELKNKNRIGFSISHISNANLGKKNPGAEVINISYQIPY